MPVSATSARIYVGVPTALNLDQSALDAIYTGIKAANVNYVRVWLPWIAVQQADKNTFSWTAADRAVNRAFAAGLNVMILLAPPLPGWTTTLVPADFANFASAVAARYKTNGAGIAAGNAGKSVTEFQVWEEPNALPYWPYAVNATEYAAVLKAAYSAIKKANSGATVIMAGLQSCTTQTAVNSTTGKTYTVSQEPVSYLNALYTAGVKGYFDIAAFHPQSLATAQTPTPPAPSGNSIKVADDFYNALKAKEPAKKMYWTAVGYDTAKFTPTQQAAYLDTLRWFAEDRKAWVTGLGVFSFRD